MIFNSTIGIWVLVVFALLVQETAITDAALFQARENNLNLILVNLIWFFATIIDVWIGYKLGKWVQTRFRNSKLTRLSNKWAKRLEKLIGSRGEKFALILLGTINFPYLNSFIASWLKISFRNMLVLILIGDAIWLAFAWAINLGIRSIIPNPHLAFYLIVGTALILSIFYKIIFNKIIK